MPNTVPQSERPLGLVELAALGMNGIIGVGIFFAPSQVAGAAPGASGIGVYALVLLALLPVALVYAALGSRPAHTAALGDSLNDAPMLSAADAAYLIGGAAASVAKMQNARVRAVPEPGPAGWALAIAELLTELSRPV